jgi:hypothetical protein
VRELLLHGKLLQNANSDVELDFANWSALAKAVNQLRNLEDHHFAENHEHLDVMLHLNRVAHRQFRWQGSTLGIAPCVRALKVYGGPELDSITQGSFGMTMLQLVRLSFAVCGHFLSRWDFNTNTNFEEVGIPRDAARAYFDLTSCEIPKLRKVLQEQQRYDHSWAYTWNPLEATPLIRVDSSHPNRVICPIPRYALSRGTTGVFYDVVKKLGFDNKYGEAFQTYVGDLLRLACPTPALYPAPARPVAPGPPDPSTTSSKGEVTGAAMQLVAANTASAAKSESFDVRGSANVYAQRALRIGDGQLKIKRRWDSAQ